MNKLFIGVLAFLILTGCTNSNNEKVQSDNEIPLLETMTCTNVSTSGTKKTILYSVGNRINEVEIKNEARLKDYGLTKEEALSQHEKDQQVEPKGVTSSISFRDDMAIYETKINVSETSKGVSKSYGLIESKNGEFGLKETIKVFTEIGFTCK